LDSDNEGITFPLCFAIDSSNNILLGTFLGIYRYMDGWVLNGAPDAQIWDMEINSLGECYACGYDNSTQDYEIFYSDNFETWERVNADKNSEKMRVLACNNNTVYAGTLTGKLMLSKDKGKNWEIIDNTYKSYLDLKVIDGYLYAATTTGLLKSKTYLTISEDVRPKDEKRVIVYPNPVTSDYEMNFSSDYTGELTIIISDNLGNEVQRISQNKQSGEMVLPLSSELLVSGSYFYRIYSGETTLSSGSFTVIK
jgi:hypothetical protein